MRITVSFPKLNNFHSTDLDLISIIKEPRPTILRTVLEDTVYIKIPTTTP